MDLISVASFQCGILTSLYIAICAICTRDCILVMPLPTSNSVGWRQSQLPLRYYTRTQRRNTWQYKRVAYRSSDMGQMITSTLYMQHNGPHIASSGSTCILHTEFTLQTSLNLSNVLTMLTNIDLPGSMIDELARF